MNLNLNWFELLVIAAATYVAIYFFCFHILNSIFMRMFSDIDFIRSNSWKEYRTLLSLRWWRFSDKIAKPYRRHKAFKRVRADQAKTELDGEFDRSLDMDGAAMLHMNKKEKKAYVNDLVKRRNRAHNADFN